MTNLKSERTSHESAGWKTRIVGLLSAEYGVKKVKGVVKKKKQTKKLKRKKTIWKERKNQNSTRAALV